LPEIVQEIGALAGFPAFAGLAVLSALYVAQAREIRRLREWAGRAPERSQVLAPAPAGRTATGARGARRSAAVAHPASGSPGLQPPAIRKARLDAAAGQLVRIAAARPGRWRDSGAMRSLAVALAGLLVLASAARYGVGYVTGDGRAGKAANDRAGDRSRAASEPRRRRAPFKPSQVTVAVLNGTTVPRLAATLREQIAVAGFRRGIIDVYSDQQISGSVVEYASGYHSAAKAVGERLGIAATAPVAANARALAGGASVVVIAGSDKAP
jgi:hypothetical protein